eukprot:gene39653-6224_t
MLVPARDAVSAMYNAAPRALLAADCGAVSQLRWLIVEEVGALNPAWLQRIESDLRNN